MNKNTEKKARSPRAARMVHPTVYIIGEGATAASVRSALERVRANLNLLPWSRETLSRIDEKLTAVILV